MSGVTSPIYKPTFQGASLRMSVNQSLALSAAQYKVAFDTVHYNNPDITPLWSSGDRLIVPEDCVVRFRYSIMFAASTVGQRYARVWKNGASINGTQTVLRPSGAGETIIDFVTRPIVAVTTDYFELWALQDSGAALDIFGGDYSYFEIEKVE